MEVTDKLLTDVEELLIASESDQGAIASCWTLLQESKAIFLQI